MKMCHSEIIKYVRELESKKATVLQQERNRCTYSYYEEGNKIVPNYSYSKVRKEVDKLDAQVRALRHALAVANCTVKVDEFGITIGEALVMLAQLQNKCAVLESMAEREAVAQHPSYSGMAMQITACNYDVEKAMADYEKVRAQIAALQVAIDRANLTNFIEVEI